MNLEKAMEENIPKNCVITSNNKIIVIGNQVIVNGIKMPPCPKAGNKSTIINNKIFLNRYELVDGKWKKTLRALWFKFF